MGTLGGAGIGLGLRGQQTNAVPLPAGTSYIIPAGNWAVSLGAYTYLQTLDPVTGIWRTTTAGGPDVKLVQSDGANWRLANLTGCPVGAVITNAGATGGTTGIGNTATSMTATASSGSSKWTSIVGGALSATCLTGVTGSSAGAGYLFPPTAIISAPPKGGLQATATCTVTGGTLLAAQVTITNQGAGYAFKSTGIAAASISFINDPRDTAGAGATIQLGLTGTGQLTGLYCTDQGTPLTGVPTLSFANGSAAATVVMNFTVTTFSPAAPLTTLTFATGTTPMLSSIGNIVSASPIWTNPLHEKGSTFPRPARIQCALVSNAIALTGSVVEDGGLGIQAVPNLQFSGQLLAITGITGAIPPTATVGGVSDTSWIQAV